MKINTGCWVDGCKCFDASDEDGVGVKRDRQWVGLTDREISEAWFTGEPYDKVVRMLEALLKEKNT